MSTVELTSQNYCGYLKSVDLDSPDSPRLYRNRRSGYYEVLTKEKFLNLEHSFTRLTLKEITLLGHSFKSELLQSYDDAQALSKILHQMAEHKNANVNKKNSMMRSICRIWDCLINKYQGLGFTTTASLAESLSNELGKVPAPSKEISQTAPVVRAATPKAKPTPRPFVPAASTPNMGSLKSRQEQYARSLSQLDGPIQNGSSDKPSVKERKRGKALLEQFRTNYESCDDIDKKMLFQEVTTIDPKLIERLKFMSNSETIDFDIEPCRHLIYDMLRIKTESMQSDVVEWLIKQPRFSADLLANLLNVLWEKSNQQGATSNYAVTTLLKHYKKNFSNLKHDNRAIIFGMAFVLKNEKKDVQTRNELLGWMIQRREFDCSAFKVLMSVIAEIQLPYGTAHLPRDQLMEKYNQHPEWQNELKSDQEGQEILRYLAWLKSEEARDKKQNILLEKLRGADPTISYFPKLDFETAISRTQEYSGMLDLLLFYNSQPDGQYSHKDVVLKLAILAKNGARGFIDPKVEEFVTYLTTRTVFDPKEPQLWMNALNDLGVDAETAQIPIIQSLLAWCRQNRA